MIDAKHFAELVAYERDYAIPDSWLQSSSIATTVANVNITEKNQRLNMDAMIPGKNRSGGRPKKLSHKQQKAFLMSSVEKANRGAKRWQEE